MVQAKSDIAFRQFIGSLAASGLMGEADVEIALCGVGGEQGVYNNIDYISGYELLARYLAVNFNSEIVIPFLAQLRDFFSENSDESYYFAWAYVDSIGVNERVSHEFFDVFPPVFRKHLLREFGAN